MLAFRKALGILVSLLALAGLLVTVVLATRRIDQRPRTDDAYLQADLVHMAPDVSGRIVELDVRDNQAVRKGDVLFRIDPEPYRMRVDQARAAVRGLEAKLALTADQVAAQTSKAGAAERGIGSAEAQRSLASSTLGRLQPLLGQGFVTAQQVDQAGMAPGQRATVYVMAQPSRALRGQVDSLGWGVASDVSATIGGLPHVERTLNWVRIAARFPVRILLDAPPDDLMRFGATAVVVIDK